ncbi:MAG: DegV family protein [Actinobacteria bacterium]|nr:MAG: DegV family protein [Actinomycetota bacterium]
MAVRIVTDSASSISDADIERLSITTIPLLVFVDGRAIPEEELRAPDFFVKLADMPELPRTSQPSPEDFAEAFRRIVDEGDEALAVLISAGMSGTVQSASLAAAMVRSERPNATIEVVDSRSNSLEEGFAVLAAAEAAAAGKPLDECARFATEMTRRTRFLFTPRSLEYLRRGGRISAAAGLLGVALRIAPILTAEKGATGVAGAARNTRNAWAKIGALMRRDIEQYGLRQVAVQFFGDGEDAERFVADVVAPIVDREVLVVPLHPVVGLHVGPAVGVVYETDQPMR